MNDNLSLSESSSRTAHILRDKEAKRAQEQRQNVLYLVAAFLEDHGYVNSHQALCKEAQLSKQVQVCDNIDLEIILQEHGKYYFSMFNKYPKICKKREPLAAENIEANGQGKKSKAQNRSVSTGSNKTQAQKENSSEDLSSGVTVTQLFPSDDQDPKKTKDKDACVFNHKSLKPLAGLYPTDSEWYEIAKSISLETVSQDLNVKWNDIVGLEAAKTILLHVIVDPMRYPKLFSGKFSPPKGVLLHGPPGTGKTMLAKAVASECECTFFNITSSSIVSKWRGDSEKYVRVLFDLAKYYAPTVIFIDEVDWISYTSESEPARRFRAEFLTRLDGLLSSDESGVTILAATNCVESIDEALLRRLGRRVPVQLPGAKDRLDLIWHYLSEQFPDKDLQSLSQSTHNYSYADLKLLCKEAWRIQIAEVITSTFGTKNFSAEIPTGINKVQYFHDALKIVKPASSAN